MNLTIHLSFNGQCQEAFRFYAECLRGEIVTMLAYGNSPMSAQVPPEFQEKIVHATLKALGASIAGADALLNDYHPPAGFYVLLDLDEAPEAERIFAALAEKGEVRMPLQPTFWASRFGVLVDRFGIPWEINCGLG